MSKASYMTAADFCEIQNLIHQLLHNMDAGDAPGFAALFTEDGLLEVKLTGDKIEGYTDIRNWAAATKRKFDQTMHFESNVVIESADEDMATNLSYWKAESGGVCISMGIHRDVLFKVRGVWKVKRRVIEHTWTKGQGHIENSLDSPRCSSAF